jgi:methylated-DNA-[protein]-cysteine S-methyltransferase
MQFHPETCHKNIQSPWGSLTLAANPTGLSGVWFEKQKHFPDTHAWTLANQHPTLLQAEQSLQKYFDQKWPRACSARKALENLALDLSAGTDFQKAVWNALMSIPLGQTCSYGQLAAAIGRPMAVRAVGTAVGRNPISILIPCHRVMGSQGQITGYAGGVWRKQALLKLENASINSSSAGHNQ